MKDIAVLTTPSGDTIACLQTVTLHTNGTLNGYPSIPKYAYQITQHLNKLSYLEINSYHGKRTPIRITSVDIKQRIVSIKYERLDNKPKQSMLQHIRSAWNILVSRYPGVCRSLGI